MNDVNNDGDSSDSENENDDEAPSSDEELSFESDDEGNYQQNVNKKHQPIAGSDSEEDEDEEIDEEASDDDDDGSGEEIEDEEENEDDDDDDDGEVDDIYSSDGSEELSFEEDSEKEDKPSTSSKKPSSVKLNGTAKQNTKSNSAKNENKTKESGSILRVKKSEANAVEAFKNELKKSDGTSTKNGTDVDEYEKHDTDDEEDIRNTVGNIPMHWYDEYKHIGYDWDAKKIIKPTKRDQLDDFLKRMEDPNFWRTVKDPQTGQDVILSEADIDLIKRINSQRVPDANFDDYTVCILDFFLFVSIH